MINLTRFALILAAGLASGSALYALGLKKKHIKPICALTGLALGVLFAALGAKVFGLASNLGADLTAYGAKALVDFNPEKLSFAGSCLGYTGGIALALRLHRANLKKGLEAFALPGCLILFFARLSQGQLGLIGYGDYLEGQFLNFYPFAVKDEWGDPYLAVYRLEALAALITGVVLSFPRAKKSGLALFPKTVYLLCAVQLVLELLKTTWLPLVISFIRLDQVLCAFFMLFALLTGPRAGRGKTLTVFFLCIAVNGFTQYVMDKPYLFFQVFPEQIEMWLSSNLYPLGIGVITLTVLVQMTLAVRRQKRRS